MRRMKIGALDNSVKLLIVTFNFNNWKWVPEVIPQRPSEGMVASAIRKTRDSEGGVALTKEPIKMVDATALPQEAQKLDYELVNASVQARHRPRKRSYPSITFTFAKSEDARPHPGFSEKKDAYADALNTLLNDTAWRFRAFRNPFYKNGRRVAGMRTFQINLESRFPLVRPDGTPIAVWKKDENGDRIGDAPVPVKPRQVLQVKRGVIEIVPRR